MYRALKSFAGKISMYEGQERKITDKEIISDLLKAKYIEEIKPVKKSTKKKDK